MDSGIAQMNIFSIIKNGGPIMWPILLCSVFSLAIIIEKIIYFASIKTNMQELKEQVFENFRNNKIKQAIQLCETNKSPVAKILKAGIIKSTSSREEMKQSMEDASLYEIPKLESRLSALSTISNITPLLGLLGTVIGMTNCFFVIKERAASLNPVTPGDLAGGIGQALLTTIAGLLIAIPAFIIYNYFISKVNSFVLEMEKGSTELIQLTGQISQTQT